MAGHSSSSSSRAQSSERRRRVRCHGTPAAGRGGPKRDEQRTTRPAVAAVFDQLSGQLYRRRPARPTQQQQMASKSRARRPDEQAGWSGRRCTFASSGLTERIFRTHMRRFGTNRTARSGSSCENLLREPGNSRRSSVEFRRRELSPRARVLIGPVTLCPSARRGAHRAGSVRACHTAQLVRNQKRRRVHTDTCAALSPPAWARDRRRRQRGAGWVRPRVRRGVTRMISWAILLRLAGGCGDTIREQDRPTSCVRTP